MWHARQVANYPCKRTLSPFILLFLILLLSALACDIGDIIGGGKPNAIITSPPSGSTFHEGEDIAVQSVSTDAKGIDHVDLLVDGQVVRTDKTSSPQEQFTLIQTWKATQGSHTILVRAYNTQNVGSDPAAISLQVLPTIAGGVATPTSGVPPTTAPGIPSITPAPGGCTNNSAFVADVTVPDGTTLNAGQTFNKIWRLSNNGTCAWSAGYQFVFASGEAMTANTVISVPSTAPGATADLLVPMTAPSGAGSHTGSWRLRSSGGVLFGTTASVRITVPGAPAPTATNTSVPVGCSGNPVIASFTASPNSVTAGATVTLTWGAVTNADTVDINQGIGGIGTPGSTTVTPATTTTYTMAAHCGTNTVTSSVTVTVTPVVLANFGGHWDTNFGPMDLAQTGATVSGTYSNGSCTGTISGTVSGSTLDGTWGSCGSGSIHFVMAGGGNRWDGNWGGSNKWCAARTGLALASGCGFAGHWNLNTAGNPPNTADLTQIGTTVSGAYGTGGTITGTVTGWTLNGTWNINSQSNSFVWVIDSGGNLNFRGNFSPGSVSWCGWRDGQPAVPSGSCHN